jgi:hypothetical protein
MTSDRRIALVVGVLFLITFVTSIPALWAFQPVLDNPAGYISGGGSDSRILFGALLEMFLIVANVGTAVVLFPILRRQSETLSLGYVTARLVECTFIAIGIVCVLGVVSLGQDPASAASVGQDAAASGAGAAAAADGVALAAVKDWTFVLGPGFIVGLGNGQGIATIPEFLWELSLGLYLTFKGFKPSPVLREPAIART